MGFFFFFATNEESSIYHTKFMGLVTNLRPWLVEYPKMFLAKFVIVAQGLIFVATISTFFQSSSCVNFKSRL